MEVILFFAVAGFLAWVFLRPRPELDTAAAESWASFHSYAAAEGLQMLYIEDVYQHASRGSKAYVSIYGDTSGIKRDAWFWWTQVHKGSVVAVRPTIGWGPHSGREDVLYIGTGAKRQSGVYGLVDAKTLTRACRCLSRQQADQSFGLDGR
ncbi:hypothetical protein [Mycolicibacterium mageritense]|uniref:hypothetical protein n=1 Tax=Mycolicibacterium mageritense TaxID=53462 RepID=UPI001E2C02A3|nr:hypothetical protein [Mycolicibacterium mageritense]